VLRLERVAVTPGGKGVNVARAARALGVPAELVAFLPGHTGRAAAALIAEEGLTLQGVHVAGEIRSTSVILEADGRATVLNEPGPPITPGDWAAFESVVGDALPSHGALVCSGSLPPRSPDDAYGRLVRHAHAAGLPAVVDANGPALANAVAAGADVVTPNLGEAEGLLHGSAAEEVDAAPDARPRAEAAAVALVRAGARAAVVTAAASGAALAAGGATTWVAAPRVAVRNPIGAGDVFAAALAAALERGHALEDAVRRGVAAAAASVEAPRAGDLDPERMAALLATRS
jgi:1-phosphofructokinase